MWDLRKPTSPPPGVVPLSPNFTVRDDRSDPVSALAFSRDGTRLALGTFKGAWVADLRNPRVPPLKLAGRPFGDLSFTSIDFSPDGAHVAGGTTQGDLIVWNLRDQSLRFFQTLADPVTAVAFSSDGKRLASAGSGPDFNIRLWDPTNHNVPSVLLRGQDSRANALAFSPDVKQLVSVGEDGRLRFWNLSDPRTLPQVVQAHVGAAISVAFLRDGKDLATAGRDHVMRIWNLRAGAPLGLLRTRQDQHFAVQSLTFSPDNAYLVSASADRTARVWNLRNLSVPPVSLLHEEAGPQGAAGAQGPVGPRGIFSDPYVSVVRPIVTSFSADSARLVTATSGAVRLWNTGDLSQPTRVWTGVTPGDASSPVGNSVALVAIHQRGPVLSRVISEPLALKQWDLRSEVSQQIRADLAVFSDDLTLVASPAPNNSIQVWNLRQRDVPPLRLAGHRDYVTALAFSHDGALLASVGGDRAVRVWDLKKPDVPIFEFEGFGYFVQFSPDDTRLFANGTALRDVLMWFLREPGHPKLTFNGGTAAIRSVAFSRDGTFFALGDVDGDVWLHRLWSGAADSLCTRVTRNLSVQEWRYYLGESVPYERTCPGLPAG
jgi:WD40 repeat protein